MPIGSKKIEICAGSITKEQFQDNYKFSVTFEKRFSAVPIVTISMFYSNKEVVAENDRILMGAGGAAHSHTKSLVLTAFPSRRVQEHCMSLSRSQSSS